MTLTVHWGARSIQRQIKSVHDAYLGMGSANNSIESRRGRILGIRSRCQFTNSQNLSIHRPGLRKETILTRPHIKTHKSELESGPTP